MKTFKVRDTEGNIHNIDADGYGFSDMDCMMEFQGSGVVVFAIPLSRIAWIKVTETVFAADVKVDSLNLGGDD